MSQTAISTTVLKQNNYAVQAGDLVVPMSAMDATNGNSFIDTGREVLIFQNTDTGAHTITITSTGDKQGRLDTSLTAYSLAAGAVIAIQMKELSGWASGGVVTMTTTSALVKMAVLQTN